MYAKKILFTAASAPALGKSFFKCLILRMQCSCTKLPSTRIDVLMIKITRLTDANLSLNNNRKISHLLTKESTSGLVKTWTSSKRNGQWNQWLLMVYLIIRKRFKSSKSTSEEKRDMRYSLRSTLISAQMEKRKLLLWTEAGYRLISKKWDYTTKAQVQSLEFSAEVKQKQSIQLQTLRTQVTITMWILTTALWSCS